MCVSQLESDGDYAFPICELPQLLLISRSLLRALATPHTGSVVLCGVVCCGVLCRLFYLISSSSFHFFTFFSFLEAWSVLKVRNILMDILKNIPRNIPRNFDMMYSSSLWFISIYTTSTKFILFYFRSSIFFVNLNSEFLIHWKLFYNVMFQSIFLDFH